MNVLLLESLHWNVSQVNSSHVIHRETKRLFPVLWLMPWWWMSTRFVTTAAINEGGFSFFPSVFTADAHQGSTWGRAGFCSSFLPTESCKSYQILELCVKIMNLWLLFPKSLIRWRCFNFFICTWVYVYRYMGQLYFHFTQTRCDNPWQTGSPNTSVSRL